MKNYIDKPDIIKWYINNVLLIIRLTTVVFMVSMFQVSASTVAKEFNYVRKEASLIRTFKKIKKHTGYNIIWNKRKIDVTATIGANFKKAIIHDVLNKSLSNLPLTYSIKDKMVMIKEEEPSFCEKIVSLLTAIDVRGRVVDENNVPLVGATVKVKNSTKSTLTDNKGYFTLNNIEEESVLVISYIGYDSKELRASENLSSISLILSTDKLHEVEINAGYYTVTDRERTGSISRVASETITQQPVNNVLGALVGRMPGVQITQSTGVPGGGFVIQIRGQNSIRQGNEPFYIIDGVQIPAVSIEGSRGLTLARGASPLASLNPSDIESIEVLKDADATAIYGSRGSNGVILITTKRGKSGTPSATFSINQGVSRVGKKLDLMNTVEYISMRKEALANDKIAISTTDYDINNTWDANKYTDWQKELIGKTAPTTNIQTNVAGGSDNLVYSFGGAFYRESTVFPGESSFRRTSANLSLQYTSQNNKLKLSFDGNYSQINSDLISIDLTRFITLAPNYPNLVDEKGTLHWQNNTMYINPIANIRRPYNAKTNNLIGNATLNYNILSNLKLKGTVGYTSMYRKEFSSDPLSTYSPIFNYGPDRRKAYFTDNSTNNWIIEGQVDWSKKLRIGELSLLVGATFQQGLTERQEITASGHSSDALLENIEAASLLTAGNSYFLYRYNAIYARINYALKDRYILNATGRRDGSSRFGADKQFANFGALGAAWIISKEKLIRENVLFISFAKLRGSYGVTGNDRIPDYGYLNLWTAATTYQGVSTLYPYQIANPDYSWEVTKKTEIALELGLFKDRVGLSGAYYTNRSSNQLLGRQITPSTGFTSINSNLSAKVANTGWEFLVTTKNFADNKFVWSTSFNLTIPKNKLISYPGLITSNDASFFVVGQPLSIRKTYRTTVDPLTGLYTIIDQNNDGLTNLQDMSVVNFIGQKFYGGLQNSFSYKGIDLDFMFQFTRQFSDGDFKGFSSPGRFSTTAPTNNQLDVFDNRWLAAGNISDIQKFSSLSAANTAYTNGITRGTYAVKESSFIRLKNVSISYIFPQSILKQARIRSAKFFLQGQNLFTITKYKGLDPETQSLTNLPVLQVLSAGVQLTL